jgi:hypothetical protein
MNPEAEAGPPPPLKKDKELENGGGGGEVNVDGIGVLPVPGGPNLDAAEDDGDRGVKEEGARMDDQSPDGALSPKEIKDSNPALLPPPPALKDPSPGQSGQDHREAAHLNSI